MKAHEAIILRKQRPILLYSIGSYVNKYSIATEPFTIILHSIAQLNGHKRHALAFSLYPYSRHFAFIYKMAYCPEVARRFNEAKN